MSNRRDRESHNIDDAPVFESNTESLLRSGRLYSLYDSDKWELGRYRTKAAGRKPRRKDHRG